MQIRIGKKTKEVETVEDAREATVLINQDIETIKDQLVNPIFDEHWAFRARKALGTKSAQLRLLRDFINEKSAKELRTMYVNLVKEPVDDEQLLTQAFSVLKMNILKVENRQEAELLLDRIKYRLFGEIDFRTVIEREPSEL